MRPATTTSRRARSALRLLLGDRRPAHAPVWPAVWAANNSRSRPGPGPGPGPVRTYASAERKGKSTSRDRALGKAISQNTQRLNSQDGFMESPSIAAKYITAQEAQSQQSILLPSTIVTPPLSRFPRSVRAFFSFAWTLVRSRFEDRLMLLRFSLMTKPKLLKRALWRPNRKAVIPEARALHRDMCAALAQGDVHALRDICAPNLYRRLAGLIAARPRGRSYQWDLVRYTRPAWYPRVADAKILCVPVPARDGMTINVYQVVVSIASRQRRVAMDRSATGGLRPVPASEKEVDLIEHVVLQCYVDQHTYEQSDWRIFATLDETLPDALIKERESLRELQQGELSKYQLPKLKPKK